jgi:integrase
MRSDTRAPVRGAIKFTDRALQALTAPAEGKKDYFKFDTEGDGLGIRVGRKSKTFVFQKLVNGRRARIPIGAYPATPIAEARKKAREYAHRLDQGEDVGAQHRAKRERGVAIARGEVKTLRSAIEGFIEENPNEAGEQHLERTRRTVSRCFKAILEKPFDELTTEDFKVCLKAVKTRPVRHNALSRAAAVCSWAAAEYKMANPLAGQKKKISKAPPPRQEFLSGEDMWKVFRAAGTLPAPAGPLIQFTMLTAVRRNEAARAKWGEFDEHLTKLEIPAGRMKGGEKARMHWVPIAPQTGELLGRLERLGDFVFSHTGKNPAIGFSVYKRQLNEALARAGANVPEFHVHDFRRSFVMWAMEHAEDFPFDVHVVANRCLAHDTFDAVKKNYNHYAFPKERRILLTAWANFLAGEGARETEAPEAIEKAREPETSDIVDVPFKEVQQPRQLPGLKPARKLESALAAAQAMTTASVWNKLWADFDLDMRGKMAKLAYELVRAIVTHPEVVAAIPRILKDKDRIYTQEFREKGPLLSEAGRVVADLWIDHTIAATIGSFAELPFPRPMAQIFPEAAHIPKSEWSAPVRELFENMPPVPSKLESAKEIKKALLGKFGEIYVQPPQSYARAFANAAADARITRWMQRDRKKAGSGPEPVPAPAAATQSAA